MAGIDLQRCMDIKSMTCKELLACLTKEMNVPHEDAKELEKRNIDGKAFIYLTREDFSLIYPGNEKFLLGSNLFRISQTARSSEKTDTQNLLDELSELDDDNTSHFSFSSNSRASTPCSSHSSSSRKRRHPEMTKCLGETSDDSFKLPVFSPDLKKCIQNDAFYTSTQRNRLIKEACMALRGYCWERDCSVSTTDKRSLAKSLLELAPKSLGDYGNGNKSSPEAGLYGQIVRWFQNHLYLDRKSCENATKKRKTVVSSGHDEVEDDEAIQSHLSVLQKEGKKSRIDEGKVTRLMSLTFASRRNTMLSLTANTRVTTTLQNYPFFKKPIYLIQDMYHIIGLRFQSIDDVRKKIRSLQNHWATAVAPAIVRFAVESGRHQPESDDMNVVTVYCLELLVDKLKPRGKVSADKMMNSLVCFAPTVNEAIKENADNTHPYIVCVGSISGFSSAVAICNRKVITYEIGQWVFSAVLTLLAIHYTFELSYNPSTQQVLEFLQEILMADNLPAKKKISTAYSNLFRALNCIQQRLCKEESDDADDTNETEDESETQECLDF